jgi:hypothetical protein
MYIYSSRFNLFADFEVSLQSSIVCLCVYVFFLSFFFLVYVFLFS